ncbi:hypothetical protein BC941DRAFT_517317 [Chlamydoabsidia padenii]|nr:hypothetical protein BC941DRAFT_517317 [Chlamydoabsidia padenii]
MQPTVTWVSRRPRAWTLTSRRGDYSKYEASTVEPVNDLLFGALVLGVIYSKPECSSRTASPLSTEIIQVNEANLVLQLPKCDKHSLIRLVQLEGLDQSDRRQRRGKRDLNIFIRYTQHMDN